MAVPEEWGAIAVDENPAEWGAVEVPTLGERAAMNARMGFAESGLGYVARTPIPGSEGVVTFGQVAKAMPAGMSVLGGLYNLFGTPTTGEEAKAFREEYAAMPDSSGALERTVAIGSFIGGSLPSPENLVPIPAGKAVTVGGRALRGAGAITGINVALDTSAQAIDISQGLQTEFDLVRLGMSAGAGAVAGALFSAGPEAIQRAKELIKKRRASGNFTPNEAKALDQLESKIVEKESEVLKGERAARAQAMDEQLSEAERLRRSPQGGELLRAQLAAQEAAMALDNQGTKLPGIPQPTLVKQPTILDGIAAAERAPAKVFMEEIAKQEGGMTGASHRLGLSLRDPAELDALINARAASALRSAELMASRDFDSAGSEIYRSSFYREAIEAATGSGSARQPILEANPNARFPFEAGKPRTIDEFLVESEVQGLRQAITEGQIGGPDTASVAREMSEATSNQIMLRNQIEELDRIKALQEATRELPGPQMSPQARRMASQAGSANPAVVGQAASTAVGAVVGSTQGETPQDRIENAMIGAGIGFGAGAVATRVARTRRLSPSERASRALTQVQDVVRGTKDVPVAQRGHSDKALKQIRSKAVGTEGMPDWYLKFRETPAMVSVRTAIRNRASLVKDTVSKAARRGADVANEDNPNLAVRLFPGRVRAAFDSIKTLMVDSERALQDAAKKAGLDPDGIADQYADYMRAKHAPAYNKYTGHEAAAGMTDAEAADVLSKFREAKLDKFFDDFAPIDRATVEATRDILQRGGLLSPEDVKWMRDNAPDYVPMNREMGLDLPEGIGGGPGFNVFGSGVRKALGSDLSFSDLRGNLMANLIDATIRSEKNLVDQASARFFLKNPHPGVIVREPKIVGSKKTPSGRTVPIYEDAGASTVTFRQKGKPVFIEFKDPKMADAFGNLRPDELGVVARWMSSGTRMFSGLVTRLNPDFLIPNLIRDRQEAFANHLSLGDWRGAFAQISPATRGGIAENMRGILDHVQNIESPDARLYRQMLADGGTSGGYGMSSREDIVKTVDKLRAKMASKNPITGKDWLKFVDVVNELSENSTRLGAYRRALQVGATRKEAALAARDASLDFDMKGKLTREFATAWAFFNPATQGPVSFTKAQIRNPKAAATVIGGITAISVALNEINKAHDPDWKNKPGLKFANQVGFPLITGKNEETGEIEFITMPIAQSMRPFKAVIDLGIDSMSGDVKDYKQALKETAAIILEQNPTGAQKGDPLSVLAPTLSRPFVDIAQNKDYAGRPIYPQFFESRPEIAMRARMYSNTLDTPMGKMAIQMSALADSLGADVSPEHISYLIQQYSGGPGRFAQKASATITDSVGNGDLERRNVPVASSFVKSVRGETSERATEEYRNAYEAFSNEETQAAMMRTEAYNLFSRVKDLPPEEWIAGIREEWQKGEAGKMEDGSMDPRFAKIMFNVMVSRLKNEAPVDGIIRQMGVQDGSRADYYLSVMEPMTPDQRLEFMRGQAEKKLMTRDVLLQMAVKDAQSGGRN